MSAARSTTRRTLVAVAESAYSPTENDDAWLENVFETARPLLDAGHGAIAYFVDAQRRRIEHVIGDERLAQAVIPMHEATGERAFDVYFEPRATSLARYYGGAHARKQTSSFLGPVGDIWGITCVDANGRGIVLTAPQGRRRGLPLGARAWTMTAVHIATSLRLRRRKEAAVEAMLAPNGKLLHRESSIEGREKALADAVVRMVEARREAGTVGSEAALDAWRALTEGRWSVVETVESDGKRFLVARRNELETQETGTTRALDDLERQICAMIAAGHAQKLIAYELGLHPASVARRLRSGMSKLRVRSRAELARHFAWVPVAR